MKLLDRNADIGNPEEYDFEDCYTRTNPEGSIAERDLVAAMLRFRGNYAAIAEALGRSRTVVFNTIGRHDEYRDLRDEIRQSMLDWVEDGVFATAIQGDPAQQRFILTTLAKDRGFVTREERTGKDGEPIHTKSTIDPEGLSTATLEELMAAGKAAADIANE